MRVIPLSCRVGHQTLFNPSSTFKIVANLNLGKRSILNKWEVIVVIFRNGFDLTKLSSISILTCLFRYGFTKVSSSEPNDRCPRSFSENRQRSRTPANLCSDTGENIHEFIVLFSTVFFSTECLQRLCVRQSTGDREITEHYRTLPNTTEQDQMVIATSRSAGHIPKRTSRLLLLVHWFSPWCNRGFCDGTIKQKYDSIKKLLILGNQLLIQQRKPIRITYTHFYQS